MKKTLFWILAILITLASAYYQRKTGPTYPKKTEIEFNNQQIDFKLLRSHHSTENCRIEIPVADTIISGKILFKRYPTSDEWSQTNLKYENQKLVGYLPKQPPAGKLKYFISLWDNNQPKIIKQTEQVIIRFKGEVPDWALIPHIIFMFAAMLLSNLSGFFAAAKIDKQIFYGRLTLILLLLGGMIFGPIIQYYAFGQAWTGIPLGWDLTDNKTLIGVVFWIAAVIANRKKPNYKYTVLAAIILFIVFSIPHSLFGSELDYEKGKVVTGFIQLWLPA